MELKNRARMFRNESLETGTVIKAKDCRIQTMFGDNSEKPEISRFNLIDEIKQHRPNAIKEIDANDNHVDDLDQTEQNIQEPNDIIDDNIGWISIDNECYEMPSKFEISLLPRRVLIYHHHHHHQITNQG